MSLHPSTERAIRRVWNATGHRLIATAQCVGVEPSTVRRVVGPLPTPRRSSRVTDAARVSILDQRRRGVPVERIAESLGLTVRAVRMALAAAGITGRVTMPACVLCGVRSWALVAYADDDAEPGDHVCAGECAGGASR